jgi:hypothetical protein
VYLLCTAKLAFVVFWAFWVFVESITYLFSEPSGGSIPSLATIPKLLKKLARRSPARKLLRPLPADMRTAGSIVPQNVLKLASAIYTHLTGFGIAPARATHSARC